LRHDFAARDTPGEKALKLRGIEISPLLVIVLAFLVLNVLLFFGAAPDGRFQTDTLDYESVAQNVSRYGDFVNSENPGDYAVRYQPGYPLVLAAAHALFGPQWDDAVVILQIFSLFLTGLITCLILGDWRPEIGVPAFALITLNPNALGMSHTIMPAAIFALALIAAVWAMLSSLRSNRIARAALAGFFLGLACLLRPDPKLLIFALPVCFAVLGVLYHGRDALFRSFGFGAIASFVCVICVLPWILHVERATGTYGISAGRGVQAFAMSNLSFLERAVNPELTLQDAQMAALERIGGQAQVSPEAKSPVSERTEGSISGRQFFTSLASYPVDVIGTVFMTSSLNFFVSGGAQNLHRLLDVDVQNSHELFAEGGYANRLSAWRDVMTAGSPLSIVIGVLAIGYAVGARVLGLIGLLVMVSRRDWVLLATVLGMIGYWVAIVMFNGLSRYRIPVEPALMILAAYGVVHACQRWICSSGTARRRGGGRVQSGR